MIKWLQHSEIEILSKDNLKRCRWNGAECKKEGKNGGGNTTHVASRLSIPLRNWTKSRVDFSERFDPSDYKIGLKKFFHRSVFSKTPILYQDRYIDWVGEALIHFLNKSGKDHFQMGQKEVIWPKEFLKLVDRDKSAKVAKQLFFCQIAILALLPLCTDFKNSFGQMTSFWSIWKWF